MTAEVKILARTATAIAVAFVVFSCKSQLGEAEVLNLAEAPEQSIDNMFAVTTDNGVLSMRLEAPLMQRFNRDTAVVETFPEGFAVYGYLEDGRLESLIMADKAEHITKRGFEKWQAFGNVVIHNVVNQETMETDTLYWDRMNNEIFTDCYVKMYSPDGFMQGYGMRSDERGRNSILHNPFNSYVVSEQDTTAVVIDSVNFIGPFPKK